MNDRDDRDNQGQIFATITLTTVTVQISPETPERSTAILYRVRNEYADAACAASPKAILGLRDFDGLLVHDLGSQNRILAGHPPTERTL